MTIFGSPQINNPGNLGVKLFRSRGGGAPPVLPWWNPDGATPSPICVGAYQAKAAASKAASFVNLPTPGTFDLTEIGGVMPWTAAGWGCVAANTRCLDTGIIPLAQSWSSLIQYTGALGTTLFGSAVGGSWYMIQPNVGGQVRYFNGVVTFQLVAPALVTGNVGMGGRQGYRDGIVDGPAIALSGAPGAQPIYIGAYNNGGAPAQYITATIAAFAIYNVTLTAPQMAARAAAMALL